MIYATVLRELLLTNLRSLCEATILLPKKIPKAATELK